MELDGIRKYPLTTAIVESSIQAGKVIEGNNLWLRRQMQALQGDNYRRIRAVADDLCKDLLQLTKKRMFRECAAEYLAGKISSTGDTYVCVCLNVLLLFTLMRENTSSLCGKLRKIYTVLLAAINGLEKLTACRSPKGTTNSGEVLRMLEREEPLTFTPKNVMELFQVYAALLAQMASASEASKKEWGNSPSTKIRAFLSVVGEVFDIMSPGLGSCITGAPTGTRARAIYVPRPYLENPGCSDTGSSEQKQRRARRYVHWWKQLPVCITLPECMARTLLCRCVEIGGGMSGLRWTNNASRENEVAVGAAEIITSRETTNKEALVHSAARGPYHIWML